MKNKFLIIPFLFILLILGCKNSLIQTNDLDSSQYGSLTIGDKTESRALKIENIKGAKVSVSGYGFSDLSDLSTTTLINDGAITGVTINGIPVGKNRVVTVHAGTKGAGLTDADLMSGVVMRAVTDINAGSNSVDVNWSTTALGNVFYELLELEYDISAITAEQKTELQSAIPTGVHATLVDAKAIAEDFLNKDIKDSSAYALKGATITFNVDTTIYDDYIVQVTDPASNTEELKTAAKRQTNRNYTAIQMMSRGVPMIVWGDEFSRTQNGNNNPYTVDSVATWSNYNMINTASPHEVSTGYPEGYHNNFGTFNNKKDDTDPGVNGNFMFMKYMLNLKANEPALNQKYYISVAYEYSSPSEYATGDVMIHIDGSSVTGGSDYLLMMNMTGGQVDFTVPAAASGKEWVRIVDTQTYFESEFNCWKDSKASVISDSYGVSGWSVVILKEVDEGTGYLPPPPEGSGNYIYLKPNSNWTQDNARFAAYFYGNGDTWVSMTDSDSDGIYECEIPAGYPNVIFCRMNPGKIENNWEKDTKWNQSANLTIPTDGKNLCTLEDGSWDYGSGSWSKLE